MKGWRGPDLTETEQGCEDVGRYRCEYSLQIHCNPPADAASTGEWSLKLACDTLLWPSAVCSVFACILLYTILFIVIPCLSMELGITILQDSSSFFFFFESSIRILAIGLGSTSICITNSAVSCTSKSALCLHCYCTIHYS